MEPTVNGTTGNDFIHVAGDGLKPPAGSIDNPGATNGDDIIFSGGGGSDIIHAGDGNDTIHFGGDLDPTDRIDGGAGADTLVLDGQPGVIFDRIVLGADALTDIESIVFQPAASTSFQSLALNDANIAAGKDFFVDASRFLSTATFSLDYSAETDANVINVNGGAGNDAINGRTISGFVKDIIDFTAGGSDSFTGDANVFFGATLSSGDHVDGFSAVHVDGDYSAGLTLTGEMLGNIANFNIGPKSSQGGADFDYRFTTTDDLVAANDTKVFEAEFVSAGNSVFIDGSAETDGSFLMAGGANDDIFIGGAQRDLFFIGDGGGFDTVVGNAGDDFISGGANVTAADTIDGGAGNDLLSLDGDYSRGLILGGGISGIETLILASNGGAHNNYSFLANDALLGPGQTLTVDGSRIDAAHALAFDGFDETDGKFVVSGGAGNDFLAGGDKNDVFVIDKGGNDTVRANDGDDLVVGGANATTADTIAGGAGNDVLTLDGDYSSGQTLRLGAAISNIDTIRLGSAGGANQDYLFFTDDALVAAGRTLTVDASRINSTHALTFIGSDESDGTFIATGGNGHDVLVGGQGADVLSGGNGDDVVSGGSGADVLNGGSGDDRLEGGAGADTMTGGAGNDIYFVDNAGDRVIEAPGAGTADEVRTDISFALGAGLSIELIDTDFVSTAAINLTGNEFAQLIFANNGNNIIDSRGGADTMEGFGGNDTYIVDNAGDVVIDAAGGGTDRVATSVSYRLGAGQSIEALTPVSFNTTTNIDLTGNTLAQAITGNAGNNSISDGGAGAADRMSGLGGNDLYIVNNSGDTVTEAAGGGTDRVATSVSYAFGAGQSIETLAPTSFGTTTDINLTGNDLVQAIIGNAGDNVIDGRGGNDTLTGRGGNDTFRYDTALSASTNVDHVTDFTVGADMIELSHAIFSALSPGALGSNAFRVGSAAAAADDRILYNSATGALSFDTNGNAAGGATQFATLSAGLTLTAASFNVT